MGSWEGSWNSSVTSRSLSFMRRGNFSMSAERGGEGRDVCDYHLCCGGSLWLLSLQCGPCTAVLGGPPP